MNARQDLRKAEAEIERLKRIALDQSQFLFEVRLLLRNDVRADIGTRKIGWFGVRGETIAKILGDA